MFFTTKIKNVMSCCLCLKLLSNIDDIFENQPRSPLQSWYNMKIWKVWILPEFIQIFSFYFPVKYNVTRVYSFWWVWLSKLTLWPHKHCRFALAVKRVCSKVLDNIYYLYADLTSTVIHTFHSLSPKTSLPSRRQTKDFYESLQDYRQPIIIPALPYHLKLI